MPIIPNINDINHFYTAYREQITIAANQLFGEHQYNLAGNCVLETTVNDLRKNPLFLHDFLDRARKAEIEIEREREVSRQRLLERPARLKRRRSADWAGEAETEREESKQRSLERSPRVKRRRSADWAEEPGTRAAVQGSRGRKASRELRRLDSLARLLVSVGVCSAVHIHDRKLILADNAQEVDQRHIDKVLHAFSTSQDAARERTASELIQAAQDIALEQYRKKINPQACKKLALCQLVEKAGFTIQKIKGEIFLSFFLQNLFSNDHASHIVCVPFPMPPFENQNQKKILNPLVRPRLPHIPSND